MKEAVLLIGHGGVPSDFPRPLVEELKKLEMERRRQKLPAMTPREAELDGKVRSWPRTPQTDPYKWGVEAIAEKMKSKLGGRRLVVAYNEFCGPSVEEAVKNLVDEGYGRISLISTMFTRGGIHSETEIPEIVTESSRLYPGVEFKYAWPFDEDHIASFLADHLARAESRAPVS